MRAWRRSWLLGFATAVTSRVRAAEHARAAPCDHGGRRSRLDDRPGTRRPVAGDPPSCRSGVPGDPHARVTYSGSGYAGSRGDSQGPAGRHRRQPGARPRGRSLAARPALTARRRARSRWPALPQAARPLSQPAREDSPANRDRRQRPPRVPLPSGSLRRPAQQGQEDRVGAVPVRPELRVRGVSVRAAQPGTSAQDRRRVEHLDVRAARQHVRTTSRVSARCGEQVT